MLNMQSWSIAKRLNFVSFLRIVLFLIVGVVVIVSLTHDANQATASIDYSNRQAALAVRIQASVDHLRRYEDEVFLSLDAPAARAEHLSEWRAGRGQLERQLEEARGKMDDSGVERIASLSRQLGEYASAFERLQAAIETGSIKTASAARQAAASYRNSAESLEHDADALAAEYSKRAEDALVSVHSSASNTVFIIIGLSVLVLGVTVPITNRIVNRITRSITTLVGAAERISSGDLDVELPDSGEDDEIGALNRSFSKMTVYLREMASVSEAIAKGDLTTEVSPRSERDTLSRAFSGMNEGLNGIVISVRGNAASVAEGAAQVSEASGETSRVTLQAASAIDEVTVTMHEMSATVDSVLRSVRMQASSVDETAASIEEMVTSIERVADSTRVLLDISNRSRNQVQEGIVTMEKANRGLERINISITSSSQIIDDLGKRTEHIGEIVEVIEDISEQTNLLALNAAIEAARAGEHGLGFAVVADEVRKLAEKSAQSATQISEVIHNIQAEVLKAVAHMEQSTGIVKEGLALGAELNAALGKITTVVSEVNKFAQEIGAAASQQASGSRDISRATTRLAEITQEISSAVQQEATGARSVVRTMEQLHGLIQQLTSGSTELAAAAEQMSRMATVTLETMNRFQVEEDSKQLRARSQYALGR